jgi:hypothetical protein
MTGSGLRGGIGATGNKTGLVIYIQKNTAVRAVLASIMGGYHREILQRWHLQGAEESKGKRLAI